MNYNKSEVMGDRRDPNAAMYSASRITKGMPTRLRVFLFLLVSFSLLLTGCSDGSDSRPGGAIGVACNCLGEEISGVT